MFAYMIDNQFSKAEELFDHLLKEEDFVPQCRLDAIEPGRRYFIFRGHSDWDWALMPSAHRNGEKSKLWQQAPQPHTFAAPSDDTIRRNNLGVWIHEELYAVRRFLEAADQVGLSTPLDYHAFESHREHYEALWRGSADAYKLPFPEQQLWPSLAFAQHYGVPTRLLDWTESPFIAAYFAAYSASQLVSDSERVRSDRIAVVALNTFAISKTDVAIVRAPRATNSFLRAQQSVFTIATKENELYYTNQSWPALTDDPDILAKLRRLSLPISEADNLLRLLNCIDISVLTLMPNLDNAARSVRYKMQLFGAAP